MSTSIIAIFEGGTSYNFSKYLAIIPIIPSRSNHDGQQCHFLFYRPVDSLNPQNPNCRTQGLN